MSTVLCMLFNLTSTYIINICAEHTHGSHPVVTAIDRNQRAVEGSSVQLRCDTDNRTEVCTTFMYHVVLIYHIIYYVVLNRYYQL